MPGPLLTVASGTTCTHAAPASAVTSNARVLVSGVAVVALTDAFPVTGCDFQVRFGAGTQPQPCVRVQWTAPESRVVVNGAPALLATSAGLCLSVNGIPAGPPVVTAPQARVIAS